MLICMCQEVYKKAQVRILISLMKSSTVCLQKVIKPEHCYHLEL